jgi:hypothetical protein
MADRQHHRREEAGMSGGRQTKYEKIAARRRESRAAMLYRQVAAIDGVSPGLAAPATIATASEIMKSIPTNEPRSADDRRWLPVPPTLAAAFRAPSGGAQPLAAGSKNAIAELSQAVDACTARDCAETQVLRSKYGTFVSPPDVVKLLDLLHGS